MSDNAFNNTGMIHLENSDFSGKTLMMEGKPLQGRCMIMVQGSFCPHCVHAKPMYLDAAAKEGGKCKFFTIQVDGEPSEKALGKSLKEIMGLDLPGVPSFIKFENGTPAVLFTGPRKAENLVEFARS